MKDQTLRRDLKMQFTKTATPQPKAAEMFCGAMSAPEASAYGASKAAVDAIMISLSLFPRADGKANFPWPDR
jgi:hypothetical protein